MIVRSRPRHVAGLLLILLLIASLANAAPASAQGVLAGAAATREAPADSQIVVEVAVGQLARSTLLGLQHGDEPLLAAGDLFDLIELEVQVDSAGRLSGVRYPERTRLAVDPIARTASVGDSTWVIADWQAVYRDGTLYLATSLLESLLDIHIQMNWAELRTTITDPEALPIGRRFAREAARHALALGARRLPERRYGLSRPGWSGAVFDWSFYYPGGALTDRTSYRFGLGLDVVGGSLELGYDDRGAGAAGHGTAAWLGVWPDQTLVRQVGLGDVLKTGPRPAFIRGAFVSNSPFVRPAAFGRDVLEGELPPGWEVEVYRDGRMVDYTQPGPDGTYRLNTPLEYGSNALEVRAYGPYGQVRTWERSDRVQSERLPPGVFEYGLALGACRDPRCRTAGNLDLHYGAFRDWTVRGGLEGFGRDTLRDLFQPYVSLTGTIADRWLVQGEALLRGRAGGDLFYEPSPDLRVGAGANWYDTSVEAPILTPISRRREFHAQGFWRPIPRFRTLFLDATALRFVNAASAFDVGRLGASLQTGVVRWIGGVRRERSVAAGATATRTVYDLSTFANLRTPRAPALDGLFLRGGLEISALGLDRLDGLVSRRILGDTRVEARFSWLRGAGEPFLSLGVTTALPAARTVSQLSRASGGDLTASSFVEGSVLWNGPAGTVAFAPDRSLRRGGLGGVVFLDANGNGRYDGHDRPLSGVRLQVGAQTVVTDAHGRFSAWDLVPFVPEDVAVDSMSLANPLWVPGFSLASVVIGPNGFRRFDVPILPAAEVTGRITRPGPDGPRPVAALRLEIEDRHTGRRFETVTFHDGELYLLGLPPGDYEVGLPEDVRLAVGDRRLRGDVRFRVRLEDGVARAPFLQIEFVRRAPE